LVALGKKFGKRCGTVGPLLDVSQRIKMHYAQFWNVGFFEVRQSLAACIAFEGVGV
jgi:hypothetical protein